MLDTGLDYRAIAARVLELKGGKKSQKEWAEELKIPPSYLSDWKKGKRRPSLAECYRVVLLTNCETEWLLYGVGPRYATPNQTRQKAIYSPQGLPATGLVDPVELIKEGMEMLKKGGAYIEGKWVREAELIFGSAGRKTLPVIQQEDPSIGRSNLRPARYVPYFRLDSDANKEGALVFDSEGMPRGKPKGYVAADDVGDPLMFAVELGDDSMEPDFDDTCTLIFAMRAKKETKSGDYALVRTSDTVLFRQVWFEGDAIRVHPENPSYPEQRLPRHEVAGIIPLFARIQRY